MPQGIRSVKSSTQMLAVIVEPHKLNSEEKGKMKRISGDSSCNLRFGAKFNH